MILGVEYMNKNRLRLDAISARERTAKQLLPFRELRMNRT